MLLESMLLCVHGTVLCWEQTGTFHASLGDCLHCSPSWRISVSQQIPGKVPPLFPPIFFYGHNPILWLHHPYSQGNLLNQEEEYLGFVLLPATETAKEQSQTGR